MKPVLTNSALVTAGTRLPAKAGEGWKTAGGTLVRTSPASVLHRRTFITSCSPTCTR